MGLHVAEHQRLRKSAVQRRQRRVIMAKYLAPGSQVRHALGFIVDSGNAVRAVPAKTTAYKRLKFLKSSTLEPKVKPVTENLSFICRICIENLLTVFCLV